MRLIRFAVLYAALALSANVAHADVAALEALRAGDMLKLQFHAAPKPLPDVSFEDAKGASHSLADYRGRYVLLNFWATWCVPCRVEMPKLDQLEAEFGGPRFAVVPLATLRTTLPGIRRFYDQAKISHLPIRIDAQSEFARKMRIMGLPITVLIDPQGQEIARLIGEADWTSASAKAIIQKLIAQP